VRLAITGCSLEDAAYTLNHGLTPRKRGFSLVQFPYIWYGPIRSSAARHARVANARGVPPPHRQPTQWRACMRHAKAGCSLEGTTGTSEQGLAPLERGVSPVQYPFIVLESTTTRTVRRAIIASARGAPPPHRQPTQWRACVRHANTGCSLDDTAGTSERGLAPRERGFSLVQYPYVW